jgi:hypothetical protein
MGILRRPKRGFLRRLYKRAVSTEEIVFRLEKREAGTI